MQITMRSIGTVRTPAVKLPRHCRISNVKGFLEIDPPYIKGLADIKAGERIVVLFWFDRSPAFTPDLLRQTPPHRHRPFGIFSTCSPRRPNPIGMSVLEVLAVRGNIIDVKGLDMMDNTPILDIKPYMELPAADGSKAGQTDAGPVS
ncbi:MAG: tRNA (N6-threonylcarbamoyladenosine(37)-N6)-methyltransferase TrmO [Deltaproteobacteria bacterium]|nr:MAG: tRNA (N6-threonylcarbamoyladenosine(37)-N6)-methyltransferase TrmO [Deltaproteobacteria bacterium]